MDENKAKSVREEAQQKYSQLLRETLGSTDIEQKDYLRHFKEAEELLNPKIFRSRRSTTSAPTLTQKQRESIEKMYNLYNSLKKTSKQSAQRFKRELPNVNVSEFSFQDNEQEAQNIEKILQTIEWSSQTIKTQKDRKSQQFFNSRSWGDWDQNPFKPFYKEEGEFTKDIQELQKNARVVAKRQQALTRETAKYMTRHSRSQIYSTLQQQYVAEEGRIVNLQVAQDSHIVQRVANYLLEAMGRAR